MNHLAIPAVYYKKALQAFGITNSEESCMDADTEKNSFVLTDMEDRAKPLPYSLGKTKKSERVKLPDIYPKFEPEFFDVISSCAEYIDKLHDTSQKIKYTKELNKIFILRHKMLAMRLFKNLVDIQLQQ